MVVVGITLSELVQLIIIFTLMNVVILGPIVLALFRAYLEWRENEAIRASRR